MPFRNTPALLLQFSSVWRPLRHIMPFMCLYAYTLHSWQPIGRYRLAAIDPSQSENSVDPIGNPPDTKPTLEIIMEMNCNSNHTGDTLDRFCIS